MSRTTVRRGRGAAAVAAVLAIALSGSVLGPAAARAAPDVLPSDAVPVPPGVSVLLVEGASGQHLLARDAERRRPVASTIKLVTALVAAEALPSGTRIVPGPEVRDVGGASAGLRPGVAWEADDLLAALLLRSGNDAAVAIATAVAGSEDAFVARMEERLRGLGIEADLATASGLDVGDALSAAELAVVGRALLAEPRLAGTAARREVVTADGLVLENRNSLLTRLDGATGLKTGFTSAAGWTLVASAERAGRVLLAVVLGAGDDEERLRLAAALLEAGFDGSERAPTATALTVRTGRGDVVLRVDAGPVTVAAGERPRAAWPVPIDPDVPPASVAILAADVEAGRADVVVADGRRGGAGGAGLGSAAASGAYAALRAAGAAGLLG